MTDYTLETEFRIYDNQEGSYIYVSPDSEFDSCKIAWHDGAKIVFEEFLHDDQVKLLIKALQSYLEMRPEPENKN